MKWLNENTLELTHGCLFAGAGGLSLGLQRGHAREGRTSTRMRCLGGIDAWPVLQGYPLHLWDGSPLRFAGKADAHWREQIGNSVPPPAAEAMACEMARTLLMAAIGTTFELRAAPVWVQPFVAALSAPSHEEASA